VISASGYGILFLSYYPLKQGLKLPITPSTGNLDNPFLSYYPLKQGLKQKNNTPARQGGGIIFILLSIKTRIETFQSGTWKKQEILFLSYYPLKQGLKPKSIPLKSKL